MQERIWCEGDERDLLSDQGAAHIELRCIISANNTNGVFRFHRVRPGQDWLGPDLDAYPHEKLVVVDTHPAG